MLRVSRSKAKIPVLFSGWNTDRSPYCGTRVREKQSAPEWHEIVTSLTCLTLFTDSIGLTAVIQTIAIALTAKSVFVAQRIRRVQQLLLAYNDFQQRLHGGRRMTQK